MSLPDLPLIAAQSQTLTLDGEWAGEPKRVEIRCEQWRRQRNGRTTTRRTWVARMEGSLGWYAGPTAFRAIARAFVLGRRRPRWATDAAGTAERKLAL